MSSKRPKLKVKLFLDHAELNSMREAYRSGVICGFTTNPSLMKKAGVQDYKSYAKQILAEIPDRPISFEAISDDFETMELEAREIQSWAKNVYVKIPITNAKGESSVPLIQKLSHEGFSLNLTAITYFEQVKAAAKVISPKSKSIISVFAGRIADTGRDVVPMMKKCAQILKSNRNAELLWASSREVYNLIEAEECCCHIITLTPDTFKKLCLLGTDLKELSRDTVREFHNDAQSAGFRLI